MSTNSTALSPVAQSVVSPDQTPCQRASALNQKQLPIDATRSMARDLPERQSVWWAAQSARTVSNPAHPTDLASIQAAEAWVKNPTPETQRLASLAASKTDFQSPGPWAAQAASWAGGPKGLTQHAVVGCVLLSAAQAGKPISPPSISAPKNPVPALAPPQLPKLAKPVVKAPALETPQMPPVPGQDGLTLTPPQRAEMCKNLNPLLKLGCDVSHGTNSWS